MKKIFIYGLCLLGFVLGQEKIARVSHPPIEEQSSLVKSKTYADVFWVTNDSGDKPYLFALNSQAEIIIPDYLRKREDSPKAKEYKGIKITGAVLNDWESLTMIADTIVIADVGNNGNARRDLGVYFVLEPNPFAVEQTRPLVFYPLRYEDQDTYPPKNWEFDCEAVFTYQGKLYFLTKHRRDQGISKPDSWTKLYRMDTRYTTQTNVLKKIGETHDLGGWVTAADMAPDGSGLVFLAQNFLSTAVWFFPTPKKGDNFLASKPKMFNLLKANQAEGVCFKDANTVIISNEQRDWFQVPLSAFK